MPGGADDNFGANQKSIYVYSPAINARQLSNDLHSNCDGIRMRCWRWAVFPSRKLAIEDGLRGGHARVRARVQIYKRVRYDSPGQLYVLPLAKGGTIDQRRDGDVTAKGVCVYREKNLHNTWHRRRRLTGASARSVRSRNDRAARAVICRVFLGAFYNSAANSSPPETDRNRAKRMIKAHGIYRFFPRARAINFHSHTCRI